jgi:hypothetical protein
MVFAFDFSMADHTNAGTDRPMDKLHGSYFRVALGGNAVSLALGLDGRSSHYNAHRYRHYN